MNKTNTLALDLHQPLTACNAGLFISRGCGSHPDRVIDSYELIFVRKGRLDMQEQGRAFVIETGQTLVLWPGRRHGGTRPYPRDLSFYWIHFRIAPWKKHLPPKNRIVVPQQAAVRRPDRLAELYHRFINDQEEGALQPIPAALLVMLILCEAADMGLPPIKTDSTAHVLAERAAAFSTAHFQSAISTAEIAGELHCNPDYLGRIFRQVKGITLTDFIHQRRLREARALLRESALNVDQIAQACGFQKAGYFRRIFRRHEGMPPLAYRRLYARTHINTR
ncbi:MAG: AraC family transcriptional regulator [Kiritimatiellaeota bacterium]|nr:AraC family transcriptional regulator [Kiritimatiellota bacterium]